MDDCVPVCTACGHLMCEHGDCTAPQVRLADGRCFNCGNLDCPNYVMPPCTDSQVAVPWVV